MRTYLINYDILNNNYNVSCDTNKNVSTLFENPSLSSTLHFLNKKDIKIKDISFDKDTIYIKTPVSMYVIDNKTKFEELGLDKHLSNIYKSIEYAYGFHKVKRTVGLTKDSKVSHRGIATIGAAGLVATALTVGGISIGQHIKNESNDNFISLEDELDQINLLSSPIEYDELENNNNSINEVPEVINTNLNYVSDDNVVTENLNFENEYNTMSIAPDEVKELYYDLQYTTTNEGNLNEQVYEKFHEYTKEYSERFGIDERLLLAMIAQESSGKADIITQIEWKSWKGEKFQVYDFSKDKYITFEFTDDTSRKSDDNTIVINEADLKNPRVCIAASCAIYQHYFKMCNGNLLATIACYNHGPKGMERVYDKMYEETGITAADIYNNPENFAFVNYLGKYNYIDDIFKHFDENDETPIIFKVAIGSEDNIQIIEYRITVTQSKKISR